MPALPIDPNQIVITASRVPETEADTPASVTIIDSSEIERLGEPLIPSLLRLSPSAEISSSGPAGSLAEVRIRGAEANHTLLFVDGIKINDPAGDGSARFELLNADLASRIEIVRGPQSALWGSDAIGGVVAVNGLADLSGDRASLEAGSFGFVRASASGALESSRSDVAGAIGWQRATGINSVTGPGEKDGYHNLSGRLRATWNPTSGMELGAVAIALTGRSEFDGFDPFTFAHIDTLDSNRNRLEAGRVWARLGDQSTPWTAELSGTALASSNRNFVGEDETNRTRGTRANMVAQLEHRFATGIVTHRLIAAAEIERETFHARGALAGLSTDQDRTREHQSLTAEWRADGGGFGGDVAIRHDRFNRFRDATTLRASGIAHLGGGFAITGSYSEGIAQPTFFDLYGFFPNNFIGNPSLKPESSRGFEGSLRFNRGRLSASLTGYRQRLHDEIATIFPPPTFLGTTINLDKTSRRQGIEAELGWSFGQELRLQAEYAFLDATEPNTISGSQIRENRRPRHSGSASVAGVSGKVSYGASIAYVGRHIDSRDVFPFDRVTLGSYWLADGKVAYAVRPGIELFVRVANALGETYQDVFTYRTEPRAAYAGVQLKR